MNMYTQKEKYSSLLMKIFVYRAIRDEIDFKIQGDNSKSNEICGRDGLLRKFWKSFDNCGHLISRRVRLWRVDFKNEWRFLMNEIIWLI